MKRKTIHLIANSHIDPVWLWTWQEGFSEVMHTCRFVVKLLEEHPDLTFTRSSANAYQWIEENDPELFKIIKRLIKNGRWFIAGPWWVQSDCNIPSGESHVRQCLYGKRYFREKFGIDVKLGYHPDSFGHNGNLPQILKKAGIDFYIFCRPDNDEKRLPQVFWWEAPDGSRILACRPLTHYCTVNDNIEEKLREIAGNFQKGLSDAVCLFGVGNHGGGPSRRSLEKIEKTRKKDDSIDYLYSNLDQFFANVLKTKTRLPVIKEDLQYDARGCYSSFAPIKRLNRLAENKILSAEILSTLLWKLKGEAYPDELERNWKTILFNQFHDILPGTAIPEAYADALRMLGGALFSTERIINEKMWSLSREIDTTTVDGFPLLFFNPTSFKREEAKRVSFHPRYNFQMTDKVDFFDEKGRRVPSQSFMYHSANHVDFLVKVNLPPMGYRVYWWRPAEKVRKNKHLVLRKRSLENQHLFMRIDPKTGGLSGLRMKKSGWNVFRGVGARFLVIDDPGNAWGHEIDAFKNVIGSFKCEKIVKGMEGECGISLRTRLIFNYSEIFLEYILYDDALYLELRGRINWREKNRMLKLAFPVRLQNPKADTENAYGSIERDTNGEENPCQRWVDLSGKWGGKPRGLSVINDGWYGCDFDGASVNMTVLRSPVFGCFKKSHELDSEVFYDHQGQGEITFRCYILPHQARWQKNNPSRHASFLNQPLEYILPVLEKGKYSSSETFIKIHPENLVLSVIKKQEQGDGIILRIFESAGKNTTGKLEVLGKAYAIHIKSREIKTFLWARKELKEVNLLEN